MPELITATRLRSHLSCQRLHQIRYTRGLRAVGAENETASFGNLMHWGLAGWWDWHREPIADSALDAALVLMERERAGVSDADWAKVHALMCGYDLRWAPSMADMTVLAVEQEFRAPLIPGADAAGKLDALVRTGGDVWIVEHKTTGSDITAGATYWQKLRMDPQISMYFAGARALGHEPVGCIYDVIARPDVRPYTATPPDKRKYTKDGRLYANQRAEDETLDEFRERLTGLITPDSFQRAEVVRLESELEEFSADVRAAAVQMLAADMHAPRNPEMCHRMYGRPCEYLDACSGAAALDDESRFYKLDNVHPELTP